MLTENSVNTDKPFANIKKGDRIEIYGVSSVRGSGNKKPIKKLIVHDGTLAFSLRGRVRFNDTTSNNYFTVSTDESISDGEIKYLESSVSGGKKFTNKTLPNVGVVIVYDSSGNKKTISVSEDQKNVITLKKRIKEIQADALDRGYEEGGKVKIMTCLESGVEEYEMEIVAIPSNESDAYMSLSGDLGDIDIEYTYLEDWVESEGYIMYKINGNNKKLKNVIKVTFHGGENEYQPVYTNDKNVEQCNQYGKSAEKRQKYEFILDELITALSSEGFIRIITEDDKKYSIKINSARGGSVNLTTASGDFKESDLNKTITLSITDDNPTIADKSDSLSVVFKLDNDITINDIVEIEYDEGDEDDMSPQEILNLILSDETLRKAFYNQPTLLGFIKSGDPTGISVAKRVLDKYTSDEKSEKDLSWKENFKNNRTCELALLSEVYVVKKDNRQRIPLGTEYKKLDALIKRSGVSKDVNLRVTKDKLKFNLRVDKKISKDTYEVTVVLLDKGSVVSYESTARIKILDYNKIG